MYGFGFFLYDVLSRFNEVSKKHGKTEYIKKYEGVMHSLKRALNTNAWDGKWFRRAFTDERRCTWLEYE